MLILHTKEKKAKNS